MTEKKKTTDATVAEAINNNHSIPSAISIEVAIWELRLSRAKSHRKNSYPWCQSVIHEIEELILLLPTRRSNKRLPIPIMIIQLNLLY